MNFFNKKTNPTRRTFRTPHGPDISVSPTSGVWRLNKSGAEKLGMFSGGRVLISMTEDEKPEFHMVETTDPNGFKFTATGSMIVFTSRSLAKAIAGERAQLPKNDIKIMLEETGKMHDGHPVFRLNPVNLHETATAKEGKAK
jgi:hypothetical protein